MGRVEVHLDRQFAPCKSSIVISRPGHLVLIIALLGATGTHWFVLQSVAWTTMLADNLHSGSIAEAIGRTFDGKHPCRLCREIANGKQNEKKSEVRLEWKKLEFSFAPTAFCLNPPFHFPQIRPPLDSLNVLTHAPPVPPPRWTHG